jgi:site-specific recombinase XerD
MFKHRDIYHVEISRNKRRSLRTRDERKATAIFNEMKKEQLRGRLFDLEKVKRVPLSEFTKAYLEYRENNVSAMTLKKDALSLKLLAEALSPSILIQSLNKNKFEEFKKICRLSKKKASNITINGYLRHIKSALTYALDEGLISKKPKIKMYPEADDLPRVLAPETINTIFAKIKETNLGDWRYFTFELWTGCRRNEGLYLDWQNCDLNKHTAKVRGKGNKERLVPLMPPVIEALEPVKKDIGKVFIQYHPDTLSKKFHKYALDCGTMARLHDLRHSAATYMLKSGIDIRVVQKILGHKHISTTEIYADVLDDLKQKEMAKLRFE